MKNGRQDRIAETLTIGLAHEKHRFTSAKPMLFMCYLAALSATSIYLFYLQLA